MNNEDKMLVGRTCPHGGITSTETGADWWTGDRKLAADFSYKVTPFRLVRA